MYVVHGAIVARRIVLQVPKIGRHRARVHANRRVIVADAHVYMGRHVKQMSDPWNQRFQSPCAFQRPHRRRRALYCVDVQMIGADVHRISMQSRFEHGDDFIVLLRRARSDLEEAVGVQDGSIQIAVESVS